MSRRPLGAIASQMIVAGTSLLIALLVLRELGVTGLGTFSLLFGILITVNSVQTGWIGDSLTVLDRFDAGIRRALFQSQAIAVVVIFTVTWALALLVDSVDATTAILFGMASVAWALEETMRRLLITRREFWKLVANDGAFALGAFGLLVTAAARGATLTIDTVVIAVLAGAIVAIGLAVVQLPRVELLRGPIAPSRMRELASFAGWRAIQVGLRPGSQALVRAIVGTAVSLEAVGRLEAARLLIAPALTVANGAGMFFLPTYSDQLRRRVRLNPSIGRAMVLIAAICISYGLAAIALREPLADLLTSGESIVTTLAVVSWVVFSIAFAIGLPVGAATVAAGRSRRTFAIRSVDAGIGVIVAGLLALIGWVDAVPIGLAIGAFVGAGATSAPCRLRGERLRAERLRVEPLRGGPLCPTCPRTARPSRDRPDGRCTVASARPPRSPHVAGHRPHPLASRLRDLRRQPGHLHHDDAHRRHVGRLRLVPRLRAPLVVPGRSAARHRDGAGQGPEAQGRLSHL